jgi:hypothetical protein
MRTLKTTMKADFIRSHKVEDVSAAVDGSRTKQDTSSASSIGRPIGGEESKELEENVPLDTGELNSTKRSRPRSKTFTFSRSDKGGSSPTKKQRSDADDVDILKSPSSTSLAKSTSSSFLSKLQKPAAPEEYVSYLRKVQEPKDVEVGKLHKLRLLLRNETVQWVVTFITLGGMTEIVGLLHRIIEVEWRYVDCIAILILIFHTNTSTERITKTSFCMKRFFVSKLYAPLI